MRNIQILDCTLRDGGYINGWNFGNRNVRSIINRLTKANVDIIECGFLESGEYDSERSFFTDVDQIEEMLPANRGNAQYVAMTRYGLMDIENLKDCDGKSIDGIRITFHEEEAEQAIRFCEEVQAKGYKVYVQPVGTTSYSDRHLLKILEIVNEINPYAFYIVDTLGLMKKKDLLRLFYLVDNNLNQGIKIGFHSHNNLQLSFSNAQELTEIHTTRSIIIDSSVYGMGRGAGNLNTELITQHLNLLKDTNYSTEHILEIIDDTIEPLRKKYEWGYSVPYYLAAINNCHPSYAKYLMDRKTLPVKSISYILKSIHVEVREEFNKEHIVNLYQQFQQHQVDDAKDISYLRERFAGHHILIIAPGSSVIKQKQVVLDYIKDKQPIVISVNFAGGDIYPHFCFFSNDRRYQSFKRSHQADEGQYQLILTSNVEETEVQHIRLNYRDYLNDRIQVNDNATLLLFALLIKLQIKEAGIAGFDGFEHGVQDHYAEDSLETNLNQDKLKEMNEQISYVVKEFSQDINIAFITDSVYSC